MHLSCNVLSLISPQCQFCIYNTSNILHKYNSSYIINTMTNNRVHWSYPRPHYRLSVLAHPITNWQGLASISLLTIGSHRPLHWSHIFHNIGSWVLLAYLANTFGPIWPQFQYLLLATSVVSGHSSTMSTQQTSGIWTSPATRYLL